MRKRIFMLALLLALFLAGCTQESGQSGNIPREESSSANQGGQALSDATDHTEENEAGRITVDSAEVQEAFQSWRLISRQPYFDSLEKLNSGILSGFFASYCRHTAPESFEAYSETGWFDKNAVNEFAHTYFGADPAQIEKNPQTYDEEKGYRVPQPMGLPADHIELLDAVKTGVGFDMTVAYTYITPAELAEPGEQPRIETVIVSVEQSNTSFIFTSCIQN